MKKILFSGGERGPIQWSEESREFDFWTYHTNTKAKRIVAVASSLSNQRYWDRTRGLLDENLNRGLMYC